MLGDRGLVTKPALNWMIQGPTRSSVEERCNDCRKQGNDMCSATKIVMSVSVFE